MKFEPLRRALARLFGPGATSVSPQITEDAIIDRMVERGLIEPAWTREPHIEPIPPGPYVDPRQRGSEPEYDPGPTMLMLRALKLRDGETATDAMRRYIASGGHVDALPGWNDNRIAEHPVQIESGAVDERTRPGIKPPPDPAAEGWTWTAWKRELAAVGMPGWAVCRFANRTGPDSAAFVFGIVRGSFGIWRQPFDVCAAGADRTEHVLTCLTHLNSGLGIGIFASREIAAEAAEIADRVCPAWQTLDPDDRATWGDAFERTRAAWAGIGVRYVEDSHCHDKAGGTYGIYTRSPESVMAGRPEKLS